MISDENMLKIIEKNLNTTESANPQPSDRELNEFISATDLNNLKENLVQNAGKDSFISNNSRVVLKDFGELLDEE